MIDEYSDEDDEFQIPGQEVCPSYDTYAIMTHKLIVKN